MRPLLRLQEVTSAARGIPTWLRVAGAAILAALALPWVLLGWARWWGLAWGSICEPLLPIR